MRKIFLRKKILCERLKKYYDAEAAILSGQSYSIEGLSLTRADLSTVQKKISQLENEILRIESTESRIRYIIPCDSFHVRKKGVLF